MKKGGKRAAVNSSGEKTREQWKKEKQEKKQRFTALQNLPYEIKVRKAELRVTEFLSEMDKRGCHAADWTASPFCCSSVKWGLTFRPYLFPG